MSANTPQPPADAPWDGVPQNPERDGWHWLQMKVGDKAPEPNEWLGENAESVGAWNTISGQPHDCAARYRYLGPCLAPSEILARQVPA